MTDLPNPGEGFEWLKKGSDRHRAEMRGDHLVIAPKDESVRDTCDAFQTIADIAFRLEDRGEINIYQANPSGRFTGYDCLIILPRE
jgi:hypothetical protein